MYRDACDITLFNLKAAHIECSLVSGARYIRETYGILASMIDAIGWEKLLALRSKVFVMETEFRDVVKPKLNASQDADAVSNIK